MSRLFCWVLCKVGLHPWEPTDPWLPYDGFCPICFRSAAREDFWQTIGTLYAMVWAVILVGCIYWLASGCYLGD